MPGRDRSHYAGTYPIRRRRIRAAIAAGNVRAAYQEAPSLFPGDLASATEVVCWRCGEPLRSCGPNRNGRHLNGTAARWEAGHTVDGDSSCPLLPECSACNRPAGAAAGNARRRRRRRSRRGVS